jgi:UDP-N-acetylmuramoylalanine--D-glutamate ligase
MIERDRNKVAVGGNIGTAALDLLAEKPDYYVLELSSYQLETTTSLRPRVAAVLNLCEDHLDRYADYDEYIQAKLGIYRNAVTCVSNLDDSLTRHDVDDVCFSLDPSSAAEFRLVENDGYALAHRDEAWIKVNERAQDQRAAQLGQLPGGDGDRQRSRYFARRDRGRAAGFCGHSAP